MKLKPSHIDEGNPQFYTATILKWMNLLRPEKYKMVIIDSLKYLVKEKRVILYAYVIMDNHIHLIWKPTPLFSLKHTQLSFMKFTAQRIKRDLELNNPEILSKFLVLKRDRKYQFWQRNALGIELYTDKVLIQKMNYIHNNPVKKEMCGEDIDYRFSSAKFYNGLGDEFDFLQRFDE